MDVAFFLKNLDDAVADRAGDHRSTAQDVSPAKWIAARKPTPKAQAATKTAVRYLKSYVGDVGIGEITPNDLFESRDVIAALPKSIPRVHRMMEFVDIRALDADGPGVDRVNASLRLAGRIGLVPIWNCASQAPTS